MKKIIISIIAIAAISFAYKPSAEIIGKTFPTMQCENYNGEKVNIPEETKGKYTLIGMAFSNAAEKDLKTWISPVYNKFIGKVDRSKADVFDVGIDYDINLYFIIIQTMLLNKCYSNNSVHELTPPAPFLLRKEGEITVEHRKFPLFTK